MRSDNNQIYIEILFHLLNVGLNNVELDATRINRLSEGDWDRLFSIANHHEVAPLLSDVILNNSSLIIPLEVRLKFLGMQQIAVQAYQSHLKVVSELLSYFNRHNIPTMIIKGLSLVQYYPKPIYRKCGDVDIYQFQNQERSDRLISHELGVEVKHCKVGHHTNYQFRGVSIENHYQFITTYYGGKTLELERLLESEICNGTQYEIANQRVQFPSPTFNAIFLPYHMSGHFREKNVSIRQMIDWMMFLKNEYDNVDWHYVYEIYNRYDLFDFINVINGILIHQLGLSKKFVFKYDEDKFVEQRVLSDILNYSYSDKKKKSLFDGIRHEWYQYITSGWKFRLLNKCGWVELIKKGIAFIIHHNDFDDKVVLLPKS